jgi:hypothetical protein
MVPLIIVLAASGGVNPTLAALLTTAATGFCITLPVSAKPVAMFSQLEVAAYKPRDLLKLSAFLLPLHFVLLIVFAFAYLPIVGVPLMGGLSGLADTVFVREWSGAPRFEASQSLGYGFLEHTEE